MPRHLARFFVVALALAQCRGQATRSTMGVGAQVPYCTNESGELLCTSDQGRSWTAHPPAAKSNAVPSSAPVSITTENVENEINTGKPLPSDSPEKLLAIQLNGRTVDDGAYIYEPRPGRFYATAESFAQWRLKKPESSLTIGGKTVYELTALPGAALRLDQEKELLEIKAAPAAFVETVIQASSHPDVKAETGIGGFLNHDIRVSMADGTPAVSSLFEAGAFSQLGVFSTRIIANTTGGQMKTVLLDSQLTRDFPAQRAALTLGDSVSALGNWGRQVHYTGVRWASKFSTQPDFLPFALPSLAGTAAEPSAVDIYVNNVRTLHQEVQSGPFSIANLPVVNGQGNIQMVVTDVMGRQQVITQSYIYSPQMLQKGVNDFAYEAGTLRRNFGFSSADYSSFFVSATHRRGITDALTVNGRLELQPLTQTAGVGADYAVLPVGIIGGGMAGSHDDQAGAGFLGYLRLQHPGRLWTFGATAQFTDSHFRQLGTFAKEVAPKLVGQAQLSHQLSRAASVSIGYLTQQNRDKANFSAATGSMSWNIGGKTFLSSAVNYAPTLRNPFSATITLGIVLGARHSFTAGTDIQAGVATSSADLTLQAPATRGLGYRVHSSSLGNTHIRTDAEVDWQNDMGSYRAQTSENAGKTAWAFEETGGMALMAGHVVPTRWLNDSFAIVEVPAGEDIKVFANNQPLTSTGKHGRALVPLVPYQQNVVHVDDENAPLSTDMDFSEKTVVPRPRSGVLVRIKANPITGAVLLLTGEDGNPIPVGAHVRTSGVEQVWEVALHGEVFIPAISLPARLAVTLPDGKCEVAVPKPAQDEVLPRIGPLVCKKVQS